MPAVLIHHAYGKSQVRLTRVTRHADHHDLAEWCVDIQLEGEFEASYTQGDNSRIIPTDTMKNTVYALARNQPPGDIETFGKALASHFIGNHDHVSLARVGLTEYSWKRIKVQGEAHPHAFLGGGTEKRTCTVALSRQAARIESGLDDLLLLKTTNSAFTGFLRDRYTSLKPADDRILATILTATWLYRDQDVAWTPCHRAIRQAMIEAFAVHQSLAIQQTLHVMAEAALEVCPQIDQITLTMPNRHRLLVDLQPFGLDNPNEIFVPTDEPFGLITATFSRA
jgi:urate oxidase